ncbi:MAG TPA: ATP-binding cassette domain-containing protein, partial [bacterium]
METAWQQPTDGEPFVLPVSNAIVEIRNLALHYGDAPALKEIGVSIPRNLVTAFIGPSGCGKSTLLRSLNRMNDLVDSVTMQGSLTLDGMEINSGGVDVIEL